MAKQIMQDVVINKKEGTEKKPPLGKENISEAKTRPTEISSIKTNTDHDQNSTIEKPSYTEEAKEHYSENFPLEESPIFEKMKRRNKNRESFSNEFDMDQKKDGRRLFGKIILWVAIFGFIGAFFYGLFFHDAVLTITQKHLDVALKDQPFHAGGENVGTSTDALSFQRMALSDEDSVSLAATGEKNVMSRSSGKVVIYNNFGPQTQRLIKNTRFQSADGKIYRINESVTIPGQKTINGKVVPGSLEVTVYADAAGEEYNIGLVDFTIPGFKGSPRYEKFFARSKTPMTGGFFGLMKIVSESDIQKAKDTLSASLKEKLLATAMAQKPKGMVLYKDAVFYSFTDSSDNAASGNNAADDKKTVTLTVKGSLTAILFSAEELSKRIVRLSVSQTPDAPLNTSGDHILVTNIEELLFVQKNNSTTSPQPPQEGDTFDFTLSGDAHAVWQIDSVALAEKLAGVKKTDYKTILAGFSEIEKATAEIHPFWKMKFPSDVSKIRVEVDCDTPCQS